MVKHINPNDATQMNRLSKAVDRSRDNLRVYRQNRMDALKQYVGAHYSDNGSGQRVPINYMEIATNIYSYQLVSQCPQVLVTTPYQQIRPYAESTKLGLNYRLKQMQFGDTLRRCVTDALFSIGIMKTALASMATVEIEGLVHDMAQEFSDCVDLDDWVHDTSSRHYEEVGYSGNRVRLPLESVREMYPDADWLKSHGREALRETADDASRIGGDNGLREDEFMQYVDLWELWMPADNLIVTVPVEGGFERVLDAREWEGSERGPFEILGFSSVPNNIMPLPPVAAWRDVHELANRVFRKIGRQADRQKTVTAYQGGGEEDAKRVRDAADGEMVRVDNVEAIREFTTGGVDQTGLAFSVHLGNVFNWMAGNLDIVGGLSAASDTAKQDQMMDDASGKRFQDMQAQTTKFASRNIEKLAKYIWDDPLVNIPITKTVPGTDIEVESSFNPADMPVEFFEMNIKVEPYSMQRDTPGTKMQKIMNLMTQFYLPMMPLMEQQGMTVSFEKLNRLVGEFSNLPELEYIIDVAQPTLPNEPAIPASGQGGAPPFKHNINERVNRPGGTRKGQSDALVQTLMGGNPQPDEAAAITRGVS